ncbi:chromate transporter [Geobacter sp. FeAm09]|uniref:chromate transporter n=1 Tax=Geobacter sp. FeAm09 TaxID=2597769 RepID=UPI0011EBC65C|nr:chromate transporter [Geobacter sp. FeAm09]QEM69003.1 chromate transporter [Geobacter sp. FeAm09]
MNIIVEIVLQFGMLSLVAFGGAGAVLPELHRLAVVTHHWMSDATFAHLVAISQATPGPNAIIVTLIGWHVAGLAGALAATIAMCGPSSLLIYVLMRFWEKIHGTRWQLVIQAGIAPLAIGLVLASGCIITRGADTSRGAYALTAATVLVVLNTRRNPLWLIGAGALLGLAGAV